jgi:hypothetical protein
MKPARSVGTTQNYKANKRTCGRVGVNTAKAETK